MAEQLMLIFYLALNSDYHQFSGCLSRIDSRDGDYTRHGLTRQPWVSFQGWGLYGLYQTRTRSSTLSLSSVISCLSVAAIQFQISIQNRYKLNKKYRKLLLAYGDEPDTLESKAIKAQAKVM